MTTIHSEDVHMPRVLYVLKRYPRLSETFIVRELIGLEATGATVGIESLLEPEPGTRHDDVADVAAVVRYLPRRPTESGPVCAAHLRVLARRPITWTLTAWRAARSKSWRRFVQAGMVADRARRERFEHIHAHFATAAAEVARDAAALSGRPFTVTAHAKDIFHTDNANLLAGRVAGASAVLTVSHYNARHLRHVLPDTTVRLVPNGLAPPVAMAPTSDGPILCVARLVPKKGVDLLIRSASTIATQRPIEIVGDGACRPQLEALVAQLGLGDRVTFLGALGFDAVEDAYRRCSMVVLPCRIAPDGDRDGLPTVLVEAMARGLAVVSTDVVGIDELVVHGRTGLLVEPDDVGSLSAAIDKLIEDPGWARQLGAAARRTVLSDFAPERATGALLAAFSLAASSPRPNR